LRRRTDARTLDVERDRPPLRQLLLGLRHGLRAHRRRCRARPDRHRQLLQRRRPLEPASRPGPGLRHVRRARRDDGDLHTAAADLVGVGPLRPRRFIAPTAIVWLLVGAAYFFIPLIATFFFSMRHEQTGKCCTLANYGVILHDPGFWRNIKTSFILSLETIVVSLGLLVPTVYWVHLKVPRFRALLGFLALVPFVVPPIILVVGLLDVFRPGTGIARWLGDAIGLLPGLDSHSYYSQPYGFLVTAYVILAFPYVYFALDAGFRAIDIHTLTEAAHSLGASWRVTLLRVIVPNIKTAALAGSFLTLAIVMGEFTIASLS